MIFRPELAKLIVQGKKSMTRRQIGDRPVCRYEVGKAYAVQPGRGKVATCRITITEVRSERLGDMPIGDAKREGFATRDEFFDYWRSLYGQVDEDLEVWVIRFLLGDHTDTPRALSARMGGTEGDYTTNLARGIREDASEPVSDAVLEGYAKTGTLKWQQEHARREAEATLRSLHDRLRDLETAYRRGHSHLEPDLRVIRQRIQKLKAREPAA